MEAPVSILQWLPIVFFVILLAVITYNIYQENIEIEARKKALQEEINALKEIDE